MPETGDTAELDTLITTLIKQASCRLQQQFDEVRARRVESANDHDEAPDLKTA
jgi:hypothetical protein